MVIKSGRVGEFTHVADIAIAHKAVYQAIEAKTGVPWSHIAVLHRRESDANFNTYLGNGDPLSHATVNEPAGRGPFSGPNAFFNGGVDALHLDGLDKVVPPWPIEKMLYWAEIFNGAGYDMHGRPSPYLWGGTNIQVAGKYVGDGRWKSTVWDTQPGCAPMLYMIAKLDPTVTFVRET
jgi:lysozyme family protein